MIPEVRPGAAKAAPGRAERAHRVHASDEHPRAEASPKAESAAVVGTPEDVEAAAGASPLSGDFVATGPRQHFAQYSCEVAADGREISLGFIDIAGEPHTIRLSLNQVGSLAMTLPSLIGKALQTRYGDHSLRYGVFVDIAHRVRLRSAGVHEGTAYLSHGGKKMRYSEMTFPPSGLINKWTGGLKSSYSF